MNATRSSSPDTAGSLSSGFALVAGPSSRAPSRRRTRRSQSPPLSRPSSPLAESYFRAPPHTPSTQSICPVCNESLFISPGAMDEHVDYCAMKRTIDQGREMKVEGVEELSNSAPYALTGIGDASEFGGFGGSETTVAFPGPMTLRRKRLLGRAALRRRPPIDFESYAKHRQGSAAR